MASKALHVVNSAIIKLSKLTKAATVYRGVAGGVLPERILTPDERGARGGVERGFLSATHDLAVAVEYARGMQWVLRYYYKGCQVRVARVRVTRLGLSGLGSGLRARARVKG